MDSFLFTVILLLVLLANLTVQEVSADIGEDWKNFSELVGIPAIILAVISAGVAAIFQRKTVKLQHTLNLQKKEFDKQTDYEFDAKKRIYEKCSPLMFNLVNLSEGALFKIHDLVEENRRGALNSKENLGDEGYNIFKASLFFRLFAPMACFKLLQERLTSFDLKLQPRMYVQYTIAKHIFYSFSGDLVFAKIMGIENYARPDDENFTKREGLWAAQIDTLSEFFIIRDTDEDPRLLRFDEFKEKYKNWKNNKLDSNKEAIPDEELKIMEGMFFNFGLDTKPILWRILVHQSRMYLAVVNHLEEKLVKQIEEAKKENRSLVQEDNITARSILLELMEKCDGELDKYLSDYEQALIDAKKMIRLHLSKFTLGFNVD